MFDVATVQQAERRQKELGRKAWSELMRAVKTMQRPVRRLLAASMAAASGFLWLISPGAGASTGLYDAGNAPGVHASIDCANGKGYVQVGNTDMAGSTIEVTIDGARRPDLFVDSGGSVRHWYDLVPNQPHRLSIVYDFVPNGTAEEENQVITVSCLDGEPATACDATGPGLVSPPVGSTFTPVLPSRVWDSRSGPGPTGRWAPARLVTSRSPAWAASPSRG